ncbi:putative sporulation-like repeat-containing protein [Brachyspira pilosicoli WesB]|uniref:Putative sporulation-like repeat-containing protein n=1 Tax=Brachyspira pilosicoli WesB TaxID=1161918 RepID=K0JK33_BRAPL|nr:SPOR domain-containing protein [Brachyspira pilosicoli]PLV58520.1 sporulation protein [Brachyspira pilosicoli SP16]WIH83630.1 SPOR domain-containing protein [Brachyspira pilosicoli]CCG57312.1 putative sporulation-like repeat-containing protein [Brachyspira pilosicoli WesB]
MEMNQKENMEERDYSTNLNNHQKNKRTLYIVNFTPIRLLVFSVSAASLVLFIFVIGFHLGSSKTSYASNNSAEVSSDILMRENSGDLDTTDTLAMANGLNTQENTMQESSIVDSNIDNIEPLNNNISSGNSSSIIREGVSSEDRYNEYTKNLASELDAINANIKGEQAPNSTYTPPEQMIASVKPIEKKEVTTTVPYTRSSSQDSIYFIQVAVGFDKDNTYSVRDTLKAKYPKTFVKEEVGSDGKTMYKIKIGRYETREDAQKVLAEIKKNPVYKDSYIYSDKKVS